MQDFRLIHDLLNGHSFFFNKFDINRLFSLFLVLNYI